MEKPGEKLKRIVAAVCAVVATIAVIMFCIMTYDRLANGSAVVEAKPALESYISEVYFVIPRTKGCAMEAFLPGSSICVLIKIKPGTNVYVEIPRYQVPNFIDGGKDVILDYTGTLYVGSLEQLKDLFLIKE